MGLEIKRKTVLENPGIKISGKLAKKITFLENAGVLYRRL